MEVRTATDEHFADLPAPAGRARRAAARRAGGLAAILRVRGRDLHGVRHGGRNSGDGSLPRPLPACALRCDRGLRGRSEAPDCLPDRVQVRRGLSGRSGDRGADLLLRAVRASRAAVSRLRASRLRPARADHRPFEADPPGAHVLAALHVAGASRRADRGGLRRAHGAAWRRRPHRGRPSLHADARSQGGALQDGHERVARRLLRECRTCAASSSRTSAVEIPGSERGERGE